MSSLTFRSRTGDLVEPASFSATEVKNEIGKVLDAVAQQGIATITRHERPHGAIVARPCPAGSSFSRVPTAPARAASAASA